MKSVLFNTRNVFLIVLIQGVSFGEIQSQQVSKEELEEKAHENFENERYESALPHYAALNAMFPKEARYAYWLGRSYLNVNQKLDTAVLLLKFASARGYGEDSYFYLGRACQLTYRFENAARAYHLFKESCSAEKSGKYDVDYMIRTNENMKNASDSALKSVLLSSEKIPVHAIGQNISDKLSGSFIPVPREFKSETDKKSGYQSLVFLSSDLKDGDYLYYAGHSGKSGRDKDIYRIRRLNPNEYSLPEKISSVINTDYDEAYPIFDKKTACLYFASKGHNSTGGYDIFLSRYDSAETKWSHPVRMDFPINSAHDDFLFAVGAPPDCFMFFSSRKTGPDEVELYTIKMTENSEYVFPESHQEIATRAAMQSGIVSGISGGGNTNLKNVQNQISVPTDGNVDSGDNTGDYEVILKSALDYQVQSDSLDWLALEMLSVAEREPDDLLRLQILTSQNTLKKESVRLQGLADDLFLYAEQLKKSRIALSEQGNNHPVHVASTQNGITHFVYNTPDSGKLKMKEGKRLRKGEHLNDKEDASVIFQIHDASHYSSENPIPGISIPDGLIYQIQLGVFSASVPENTFGGLYPVSSEKSNGNVKYFAGYFRTLQKTREALVRIKQYGYPDAFMVSYYNHQKISIQKAKEIEFVDH